MKPYYQDDFVTIYHGDHREWPTEEVGAIITDPPYGRGALPLWGSLAVVAGDALRRGGWLLAYSGQACLPEVLTTLSATLAYRWTLATVYPGGEQLARIGDMTILVGWKPVVAFRQRPFGSDRGPRGRFLGSSRSAFRDLLPRGGYEKTHHEWAQPLAEATELVARFTGPTDVVLDPFMGSGTTLAAAKALGRRTIGIEVREDQCEIAANRCRQEVLGLTA